jgi:LacI family transcriptional regulator
VSATTRERVRAAAATLGYRPNGLARGLITGRTRTLGLVVADIGNPFFARIARAVGDVARLHGYALLLANSDEDATREAEAVRALAEQRVAGLIVASTTPGEGAHLAEVLRRGIPVVQLDRAVAGLLADAVLADNRAAAREATARLIGLGHRRIGLVTGSRTLPSTADRVAGYRAALAEAGITAPEDWVRVVHYDQLAVREATAALLALPRDERPTALIATDSVLAAGIFAAARAAGLAMPRDLSLVGFDDADWATLVEPPVAVVEQPVAELGRLAAEQLLARVAGDDGPPVRTTLAARLIARASCGPPP